MIALLSDLFDAVAGMRPKRRYGAWAHEEIIVPEGALKGTHFRPRPWQALTIAVMESGHYRQYWIASIPRSGKSLLGETFILHRAGEFGDSCQILAPDQKTAGEFWKDKLEPILTASPRLARLLPDNHKAGKTTNVWHIRLHNGGVVRMQYNPKNLRAYDAAALLVTEAAMIKPSANEADAITLAQKRQADHGGGVQFFESTHTHDATRFAAEIAGGTDTRLHCPCAHCGHWFEAGARETVHVEYADADADVKVVAAVHVACPSCGGMIGEAERGGMVAAARMHHTRPDAPVFSLTVNWFHAKVTLEELGEAERRVAESKTPERVRDLLQNFYARPTSASAEAVEVAYTRINKSVMVERMSGAYTSGTIPAHIERVTAGIDIQKKWLYFFILGQDGQGTHHALDWGVETIVPRELQADMEATPAMVLETLGSLHERLVRDYAPMSLWYDTSYKHESTDTHIIREWVRARQPRACAIAGRSGTQYGAMKTASPLPGAVRDYMTVALQESGLALYFLDVDRLKTALRDRMLFRVGAPGGIVFPKDMLDAGRNWIIRHFTSEQPVIRLNRRTGTDIIHWEKESAGARCDAWDCCVYAFAGMQYHAAMGHVRAAAKAAPDATPSRAANQPAQPDPDTRQAGATGATGAAGAGRAKGRAQPLIQRPARRRTVTRRSLV